MRTSAPFPDCQKSGRLGVNPRRSHVKETERKRVKTACNGCNVRRVKCSGEQPCSQCSAAQRACEYPVTDKKVFVAASEYDDLKANNRLLEKALERFLPGAAERQEFLLREQLGTNTPDASTRSVKVEEFQCSSPATSISTLAFSPPHEPGQQHDQHAARARRLVTSIDSGATEGSFLQDRDGTKRWLGGTSGATFLDHLKKFMHTLKLSLGYSVTSTNGSPGLKFLASTGQYQTSDSQLLFTPTADHINPYSSLNNLEWNQAGSLLAKVDEYLQNCANTWPCGGIHYFGDLSAQSWLGLQSMGTSTPRRESAFYEAAFAVGTIYSLTAANSRRDGHLGEMFFARTRNILGDPMNISHYSFRDVPTLALMAMYMAEMNRRDNAYVYLSHATTVCCMFGGMKGSFSDERDRRIVWTLFCLSKDVSCLMGRPPQLPDEAFQLPLPEVAPGLPPPYGLIAHIELSKIAGYIVSNTYSIAPRESVNRSQNPFKPLKMLEEWRENLPPDLQIPLELAPDTQIEIPKSLAAQHEIPVQDQIPLPIDRALCMLHMKWNQLLILTLRPLFFLAVKSSIGGDFVNAPRDMLEHPGIEPDFILQCSAAARRNLRLGRHIHERCSLSSPGKLVMLELHHIFNAAVVLLLHQMVFSNVVNTDTIAIRAARRIFELEARTECAEPCSGAGAFAAATGYASDCVGVLNDLAALVARTRPLRFKGSQHATTGVDGGWASPVGTDVSGANGADRSSTTGTLSGSPVMLSEEQLAENLSQSNPYGSDGFLYSHHFMMQCQEPPDHTNQKELERWVQEGQWALSEPGLSGYTGM